MGVPNGHPFFGNQYTNGGYQTGTYTYIESAVENAVSIAKNIVKESSSNENKVSTSKIYDESLSKLSNISKTLAKSDLSSKEKVIIGGIFVAVASIGGVITYNIFKKRKAAKKNTIELENIGVCTDCGEPLIGSEFHLEGEDSDSAFIKCNNCGTKNYAHYDEKVVV